MLKQKLTKSLFFVVFFFQASLEADTEKRTIYVTPQNLIPDTNCFIDHLPFISALLKTGIYTLYVPLIGEFGLLALHDQLFIRVTNLPPY